MENKKTARMTREKVIINQSSLNTLVELNRIGYAQDISVVVGLRVATHEEGEPFEPVYIIMDKLNPRYGDPVTATTKEDVLKKMLVLIKDRG